MGARPPSAPPRPRGRPSRKARSQKACRASRSRARNSTAGLGVLAAFVKAGLVDSTGEARRQVKGGGLKVNDAIVTDERAVLTSADLVEGVIKLSLGKKKHMLLKPAG